MNPNWVKKYALYKMGVENIAMKLQMEWQNGVQVQSGSVGNVVADRGQIQDNRAAVDGNQQGSVNPVNGNGDQGPAVPV